jgi:hypothetical protein
MINISYNGKFAVVTGASSAWDWRPAHELLQRASERHSYKGRRDTGRCGLLETGGEDHAAEHLPGKQVRIRRPTLAKSAIDIK